MASNLREIWPGGPACKSAQCDALGMRDLRSYPLSYTLQYRNEATQAQLAQGRVHVGKTPQENHGTPMLVIAWHSRKSPAWLATSTHMCCPGREVFGLGPGVLQPFARPVEGSGFVTLGSWQGRSMVWSSHVSLVSAARDCWFGEGIAWGCRFGGLDLGCEELLHGSNQID